MTRRRRLLLVVPLVLAAAALLWIGDSHLVRRDWAVGVPVFGGGMVATFFAVRQLRLAGLIR